MNKLENRIIKGFYTSCYIASWARICIQANRICYFGQAFENWLKSIGLNDNEIRFVGDFANCTDLRLEGSAECYMENHL